MVSFQTPTSPNQSKAVPETDSLSKKRKWEDEETGGRSTKSISGFELCFDTHPLPPEWQRCLDIQSGEMHFYNTRTQKRTPMNRRTSPEPVPGSGSSHMRLDLELNLPCGSIEKNHTVNHKSSRNLLVNLERFKTKSSSGLTRSPSWLTTDGDQQEMVTAVCMQCHMLVLLCKSSPSCPNCKFMHPPLQNPPQLFKQSFSLFC